MRKRGHACWFRDDDGIGFIKVEGESYDVFIHFSEINADGYKTLNEGEYVEFDLAEKPFKQAKNLVRLG